MDERLGRELVRIDQDARRARRLAAPQARRRPGRPALPAHGPRRRLPASARPRSCDAVSLRRAPAAGARLRAAAGASSRSRVPLGAERCATASTPRCARRRAARPTWSRPPPRPLLAPRSDAPAAARSPRTASRSVRGRVLIVDARGRGARRQRRAGPGRRAYAGAPRSPRRCAGRRYQEQRHSDTLDEDLLATAVPIAARRTRRGAPCGSRRASPRSPRGPALDRRPGADRRRRARRSGWPPGSLIARQLARPLGASRRHAGEIARGDLERARADRGHARAALARALVQRDDRPAGAARCAAQQEFVADASHQLRTPLTGLRLRLEEAQASRRRRARAARELDAALREVDRLSQMVDELLLLPPPGGATRPRRRSTSPRAPRRGGALASDRGGPRYRARPTRTVPRTVTAARVDLERALDALVENALRYSPPGSAVDDRGRPGRVQVLDAGPASRPARRSRSSSASTAAAPAAAARRVPASGCRSHAS